MSYVRMSDEYSPRRHAVLVRFKDSFEKVLALRKEIDALERQIYKLNTQMATVPESARRLFDTTTGGNFITYIVTGYVGRREWVFDQEGLEEINEQLENEELRAAEGLQSRELGWTLPDQGPMLSAYLR